MSTSMSAKTAEDIGEIKGLLIGIKDLVDHQNRAVNQRLEDMHTSNTRRLDDLTQAIHGRLDGHQQQLGEVKETANRALDLATRHEEAIGELRRQATKTGAVAGVGAGTLVSVGIELAKQLMRMP